MSDSEEFEEFEEFVDYDGDDFDDAAPVVVQKAPVAAIRTLSMDDTLEALTNEASELAQLLDWSPDTAVLLLEKHNWSKARAQERYFEDPERVLQECGIETGKVDPIKANAAEVECEVCYDDVPPPGAFSFQCAHWICSSCWEQNLIHTIEKEGIIALPTKRCLHAKCKMPCGMSTFKAILADKHPSYWKKYQRFLVQGFVANNTDYQFCANPDCEKVITAPLMRSPECQEVRCESCNTCFCFKCTEENHAPAECEQLKKWKQKEKDDSETANWMVVNTKPCPKCRRITEKNGGCNHMNCTQCKHEWCWICEGEWSKHGSSWYKCNYFDPDRVDPDARWKKDKSRLELEKYIHYYSRFRNHDQSKKLDEKMLKKTRDRIRDTINQQQLQVYEVDYLERTAKTLIKCRHVLKYSYIYAYFLTDEKIKELFEYNQSMLEFHTELLSEFIEDDSGKFERQEIVNRTSTAETMLRTMEEGITH